MITFNVFFIVVAALGLQMVVPTITTSIPHVFITISSLASVRDINTITERRIQLNWYNNDPTEDQHDWIGLFTHEVTINISDPLISHRVTTSKGVYTTKIKMPRPTFNANNLTRRCLGFWVAFVRNDKSIASNCIKIEPNWMHEHRNLIGNSTLSKLFIPGTHDSGSYQNYRGSSSENIFTNYIRTQDEDLWNQFVYGIRHVDLRIGYFADKNEFTINHGEFRVNPLIPELKSIKKFLDSTKEFLILDFHNFKTGFEKENPNLHQNHLQLVKLITSIIDHYAIPRAKGINVKLNELWHSNQRVLLAYNNPFYEENELLWPGIYQAWPNTMNINSLKQYFGDIFNKPSVNNNLWSAQAELTSDLRYALSNPHVGTRIFADQVNLNITYWFKDLWWDRANCVATDYFLGNNIIEVAINSNIRRMKNG